MQQTIELEDMSARMWEPVATTTYESTETIIAEEDRTASAPKNLRFWLIILGLLIATFISALDVTGKIYIISC
jgi:hypothetical protein